MVLSNDVAIRWIRSALEMHLLDSAEAAQFLLEAADGDHSLYRVVSAHFTDCPVRLAELHALLEQLRDDPYATILTDADNGPDSVSLPSCDTDEPTTPNGRPQSKSARKPPEESTNRRRTCEAAGKQHLPMPLLSGIDRYDLQAEIGRGGCGVVSQALDRQLQRTVVLKRIADRLTGSDEIVQRFLNEARITGQLEHPGIVPVYEMGLDEHGLPFYAMRQIRGVTMADRIRALHQLPAGRERIVLQRQLLDRFRDVCQTLAYAHHSGVIHRDLKPANVMIGEFGETVLLDWGLARKLSKAGKTCSRESGHDDSDDETLPSGIREDSASATGESAEVPRGCAASYSELTQHGTIMGTATYMAPEQALGQTHLVNEQSDVFSLGVILYELLSGTSPFKTDSVETTIQRVAQCKFRPLRDLDRSIPRPLAAICERAMRRAQEDRYQSAYELAADLESFLAGGPVGVYRERAWERLDRVANKHPVVFRTIFVGSLLVAAISLTAANRIAVSHSHERQARETAVVARNDAEAAWAGERDSRMRTQTQLVASRDAADKWLLQLSGDLQFYPGLQPLRRKLIEQGREHYHQLLADSLATHQALRRLPKAADPLEVVISATEVARNYLRSGDLSHLAGDDAAAMTHFCATEQLLLDTLNHTGFGLQQDPVLATQMANAWIGKSLARPPAAEDNDLDRDIVRAIDMLTEVLAADPDCDDARHALVRARALAARTAADHQAWQDADELISQALPDAQILCGRNAAPGTQKLYGTLLEDRARFCYRAGDYKRSAVVCRDLLMYYEQALSESPTRPDLLESRSLAASLLGSCLLAQSRAVPAIDAYQDAQQDLERAWELLYGERFYRENRATLAANLAEAHQECDDSQAAVASARDAVAQLRWLIQCDGVTNDRIYRMARCYLLLASNLCDQRSLEARQWLGQSRTLIDHLRHLGESVADPLMARQLLVAIDVAWLEGDIETSHQTMEELDQFLSQHAAGISDDQQLLFTALAGCRRLQIQYHSVAAPWPADASLSRQLEELAHLADLAAMHGDQVVAEECHRYLARIFCEGTDSAGRSAWVFLPEAVEVTQHWAARNPESPSAWHWYAEALLLKGDLQEAEGAIAKAIALRNEHAIVDDAILRAVIASRIGREVASEWRSIALQGSEQSPSHSSHREFLLRLLETD